MYDFIANPMPDGKFRHFFDSEVTCASVLAVPVIDELLRDNTLPQITLAFDSKQPLEGYRIIIPHTGAIVIAASAPAGAFYGLITLKRLRCNDGAYPCGVFEDAPEFAFRGYHFTLGGGMMPSYRRMRGIIVQLAEWKYNKLIIEYDDRFPLKRHPLLVHPNAWSADELKSLIALAESYFIEVVPLLDSLGHVAHYLSQPEYAHLAENPGQAHEMCPQKPETLKLMEEIWEEVLAFHPHSKYAHITGDEVFRVRKFCDKCQPYADADRLAELFCDYYTKLSRFIIAHGKTPIIWGDMLLKYPQCIDKFPRDVIVCDWQYSCNDSPRWDFNALKQFNPKGADRTENDTLFASAADERTDGSFRAFPSVDFFREQGFTVLGAGAGSIGTFTNACAGGYPLPRQTHCMRNQQAITSALKRNHALGYLHTIWGNTGGVEYCMYSAFAGAEYAWRVSPPRNGAILTLFNREYLQCKDSESLIPATDELFRFLHGETNEFSYSPSPSLSKQVLPFAELVKANLELGNIDGELRALAINRIVQRDTPDFRQICFDPVANSQLEKELASEQNPFVLKVGRYHLGDIVFEVDPEHILRLNAQHCQSVELPVSGKYSEFELALAGTYVAPGAPMLMVTLCYRDQTKAFLTLNGIDDVQDWYGLPTFSKNSTPFIAGQVSGDVSGRIGLNCIRNPHPSKELAAVGLKVIAENEKSSVVIVALGCSNAPEPIQPTVDFEDFQKRLEENYRYQCEILSSYLIKGDFEKLLHQRIVDLRMELMKNSFK